MNKQLRKHGEVVRLARMLRCEPDELAFLEDDEGVEPATIERLSEQVTSALFDTHSDRLRGVRAAANLLPTPLAASIGERAMGPVLCALLVGAVDDQRLVAISRRLSAPFLAEVALHIDPRRVPEVAAGLPPATIAAVAAELVERGEFATLGQFIGLVTDDGLKAATAELDGEALLHAAALVPGGDRIDRVVTEFSDGQLEEVLVAAQRDDAWLELLGLVEALSPAQRQRATDLAIEHHPTVLDDLVTFADTRGHWAPVLTLLVSISPARRPALASLNTFGRDEAMAGLVAATAAEDRWADLLTVGGHLSPEARRHLADELSRLDRADLHRAIVDLSGAGLDEELVALLTLLSDEDHDHVLGTTLRRTTADRSWADQIDVLGVRERLGALAELFAPPAD